MSKLFVYFNDHLIRLWVGLMAYLGSIQMASANLRQDLTVNRGEGKSFTDIANNIDDAAQTAAGLFIQLVTIGGFVVVALSLYQLYKASKDERERPTPAVVGLFIGGAMAAVGSIMWIMRNTIIG